jgi:hypothetical protein
MPKEQLYLTDDMKPDETPDPDVPECRDAIYAWLDAKDEQARASERTKTAADAAMIALAEHKLESHPYVDPKSGKKRYFVADTTPKPKTQAAVRQRNPDEDEDDVAEEVETRDEVVEVRRVSRASVEKEIDPFSSTRKAME